MIESRQKSSANIVSYSIQKTTQIDSLIKEEIEAVRSFRDGTVWATSGLGSFGSNYGSGYPRYFTLDNSVTPPKWKINSGTETINGFTRSVVFDKVSRDLSRKYIESTYNAAHDDPDTIKITVNIIFNSKTYKVVTYLTNWQQLTFNN